MSVFRGLYANSKFSILLYGVVDDKFYIDSATSVGTLNTSTGNVWITDNGTEIGIVDGTNYYIFDGSNFSTVTTYDDGTSALFTPSSICYLDGYFILTETDTDKFYVTGLYDAANINALDFASAEGSPDKIVVGAVVNREYWTLGEKTIEVYYNSGDADFPLSRRTTIESGCAAAKGVVEFNGSLFWLSDNLQVVTTGDSYTPKPISTPQIDYQISTYSDVSDAIFMLWERAIPGHPVLACQFPTGDKTWCFDLSTGSWFEMQTDGGRHISNCHALFDGKDLVGGYNTAKVYELDMDTFTDDGTAITRTRRAKVINQADTTLFHHDLRVYIESGTGEDITMQLRYSDDGGHTFTTHGTDTISGSAYNDFAWYRGLGRAKRRVYEISTDEAAKFVMTGAYLKADGGGQ